MTKASDKNWASFNPLTKDRLKHYDLLQKISKQAEAFFSDEFEEPDESMDVEQPQLRRSTEMLQSARAEKLQKKPESIKNTSKTDSDGKFKSRPSLETKKGNRPKDEDKGKGKSKEDDNKLSTPKKPRGLSIDDKSKYSDITKSRSTTQQFSSPNLQTVGKSGKRHFEKSEQKRDPSSDPLCIELWRKVAATVKGTKTKLPKYQSHFEDQFTVEDQKYAINVWNRPPCARLVVDTDLHQESSSSQRSILTLWKLSSSDNKQSDTLDPRLDTEALSLYTYPFPSSQIVTHVKVVFVPSDWSSDKRVKASKDYFGTKQQPLVILVTVENTGWDLLSNDLSGSNEAERVPTSFHPSLLSTVTILDAMTGQVWMHATPPILGGGMITHCITSQPIGAWSFSIHGTSEIVAFLSCYGLLSLIALSSYKGDCNLDHDKDLLTKGADANHNNNNHLTQPAMQSSALTLGTNNSFDLSQLCPDDTFHSEVFDHPPPQPSNPPLCKTYIEEVQLLLPTFPPHIETILSAHLSCDKSPKIVVILSSSVIYAFNGGKWERLDANDYTGSDFLPIDQINLIDREHESMVMSTFPDATGGVVATKDKLSAKDALLHCLQLRGRRLLFHHNVKTRMNTELGTILEDLVFSTSLLTQLFPATIKDDDEVSSSTRHISQRLCMGSKLTINHLLFQLNAAAYLCSSTEFLLWLRLLILRIVDLNDASLLKKCCEAFLAVIKRIKSMTTTTSKSQVDQHFTKSGFSETMHRLETPDRQTWGNYDSIMSQTLTVISEKKSINDRQSSTVEDEGPAVVRKKFSSEQESYESLGLRWASVSSFVYMDLNPELVLVHVITKMAFPLHYVRFLQSIQIRDSPEKLADRAMDGDVPRHADTTSEDLCGVADYVLAQLRTLQQQNEQNDSNSSHQVDQPSASDGKGQTISEDGVYDDIF